MTGRFRIALATLLVCSCTAPEPSIYSPAPAPVNYPSLTQPKMQATAHWSVQAEALSRDLVARMSQDPLLWPAPIYVYTARRSSQFERAMVRLLSAELVAADMTVVSRRGSGYPLFVEARLIGFADGRIANPPISGSNQTDLAAGSVPRFEVLVTVSLVKDYRYLFRATQIVYARDDDHDLYVVPKAPQRSRQQRLIDAVREHEAQRGPVNH